MSRAWLRLLTPVLGLALVGCAGSDDDARAEPAPAPATAPSAAAEPAGDPAARFLAALVRDHTEATQLSILLSDTVQPPTDQQVDALAGEIEETVEARLEAALAEFELPPGAFAEPNGAAAERLAAAGAGIHRTFLELMLDNHRRTVVAARIYLADGDEEDLRELAAEVAQDLDARITRMAELLVSRAAR